jgi:hypothetical protein
VLGNLIPSPGAVRRVGELVVLPGGDGRQQSIEEERSTRKKVESAYDLVALVDVSDLASLSAERREWRRELGGERELASSGREGGKGEESALGSCA